MVAYIRVSSDGQLDAFGPDTQKDAIRAWAKEHRHQVVHWCTEAVSGKTDHLDRPGFNCAVEEIKAKRADGLVVLHPDRLARQLHIQEAALAYVWKLGATVFAVSGGEIKQDDPDDPMRTFIRQVLGAVAEYERSMVEKRMRDGRKTKAATGKKAVGQYAYGTRAVGKGRDRDAGPDDGEQAAVRRIVDLRGEGRSYREVAAVLDAEGLRPRRAASWSAMSVRNVAVRAGV